MKILERPFSEDEETTADVDVDVDVESDSAADYSFEGFDVDFSEKVALTPTGPRTSDG